MKNNGMIWLLSITQTNWEVVKTQKIWAVDTEKKSKKISKGDTAIFYVSGTDCIQGIFKIISDWHDPTKDWPDGRKIILEIDLEKIETGYANIKKLSSRLSFVTNYSKIGTILMGNNHGAANFGKDLNIDDYKIILEELTKTKSPDTIGKQTPNIDDPEEYDSKLTDSPIRLHLIKNLFENLLGPKNGPGEEIENVYDSYVVGILRTKFSKPEQNIGDDPSYTTYKHTKTDLSVTQDDDEDKISPDYDLNPILGTRSMGLSFVVEGDMPRIKACFTWGRYEYSNISKKLFRRQMNYLASEINLSIEHQSFKPEDHISKEKKITKKGVEMVIISKCISKFKNRFHVSVFLINNTPFKGDHQTSSEWVFQPQIRIKCMEKTKLKNLYHEEPKDDHNTSERNDGYDEGLYLNRKNRGKGHFCGTVWYDVDPEDFGKEGFSTFSWPDSKSKYFPTELVKFFTRPDIRTEFFPTYSILQPDIAEKSNVLFNAEKFSNMWKPDELEKELSSIVCNYDDWITKQLESIKTIPSDSPAYKSAITNLENCKTSKSRINAGIQFLKSSERARLAFCFMNKAISIKSEWENGHRNFSWWEFQMAFILQCLRGVAQQDESERDLCDILWFPTGGGKTEAYLGLTIFTIIFRRLGSSSEFSTDGGVSVISRYTLRLLTIQQFQRAVGAITAADYLRVSKWIPDQVEISLDETKRRLDDGIIWGHRRISVGLFIGGSATPNKFHDEKYILNAEGMLSGKTGTNSGGEPSQILNCPCCKTMLAVPPSEKTVLDEKDQTIHWIFSSPRDLETLQSIPHESFSGGEFQVSQNDVQIKQIGSMTGPHQSKFYEIRISFTKKRKNITINGERIKMWWKNHVSNALSNNNNQEIKLASTSAERPGYFFIREAGQRHDFAIFCPNSDCQLNTEKIWFEGVTDGPRPSIPRPFKIENNPSQSLFMPIPAFTIDQQIYRRCPSMIISTVDKFAMLPFIEDFASIFGNVDEYDVINGYGRSGVTSYSKNEEYESDTRKIKRFLPPSLVIQDELHLIEGPLGSMVGSYEIAFDILSTQGDFKPKYIASSATIKEAQSQVGTVYRKKSFIFPPQGISVEDNYFSENSEDRKSTSISSGRLYLGICAPQKILTLPVRIWATLLSEVYRIRKNPTNYGLDNKYKNRPTKESEMRFEEFIEKETDPYWTLVGYFNAIKELQISRSLYDDNIKRDVRRLSCEKITTIDFQKEPLGFRSGLRFFPIFADKKMDITNVIVHCDTSKGKVAIAVFDNSVNNTPQNQIGQIRSEHRFKTCSRGENEFQLEKPVHVDTGDRLWIAIANNDQGTKFETGKSPMQSLFADITSSELDDVFEKYIFPTNPPLNKERETIRLTLTSTSRNLGPEPVELTGSTESQDLPNVLKMLNKTPGNEIDAVFTTAVFGTGIDIQRLGLMIVMGQPKTTSTYIQSTGRVGRNNPGLVITWYKATNIRDLNHYENFVGYHRMLQRYVEPISASPFSEEALRLCLGPILVSILRNSNKIGDIPIPKEWIDKHTGPMRMKDHYQDPEVNKICLEITRLLLDANIPQTRRTSENKAWIRVNSAIARWYKDTRHISNDKGSIQYLEWTIKEIPKNNVVLGTPQHDIEKKIAVFKNVRTSMREVESTASFGGPGLGSNRHLRPSQFVTTYGVGSLLRIGTLHMIIPSLESIIYNLGRIPQFGKQNEYGKRGLDKFQIQDKKIEKIIEGILEHHVRSNKPGKVKIFKLPSNADLSVSGETKIYNTDVFPKWAICRRHKILRKLSFQPKCKLLCSVCENDGTRYDEGIGIRFIRACPNGHMDDLNWHAEIHKGVSCDSKEYDWKEYGNNFIATCRKCDRKTSYNEIRYKSENSLLECSGYWAETDRMDHMRCFEGMDERANGTAKLVLKNASNLRIPYVVSSLVIPPFAGRLYKMLTEHGESLIDFSSKEFSKADIIKTFELKRPFLEKKGINSEFFSVLKDSSENEIKKIIDVVLEELKSDIPSEQDSEDSELEQLLQASQQGYPKPHTGESPDFVVDVNKVKKFHSNRFGLDFVVTPVDVLHVVKAQVGYRREVKTRSEKEVDPYMISATGDLVPTFFEERHGTNSTKWFVGKKIKGEGIFITTEDHSMFSSDSKAHSNWSVVNDKQEDETIQHYTHPIFVWWHSLAHRLVSDLSIDSGFQSTAIAEKTYFRKNIHAEKIDAGILLYAVQEGGDGTLGGLTSLAPNFDKIIERAISHLAYCSNDPLCKERKFNPNRVNGSACHACMLISETSCGLQNRFLDRNLLLESM